MERCEPNGKYQSKYPTYVGCEVHPDFIKFQDFAEWCQHQIGFGIPGYELDKDILLPGNKVYGPDTCVFVPKSINVMMAYTKGKVSDLPTGVSKQKNKYRAAIRCCPSSRTLGYFDSIESASGAYKIAKDLELKKSVEFHKSNIDQRVYDSIIKHMVGYNEEQKSSGDLHGTI